MNKTFTPFDTGQLLSFVEQQLETWPLAKKNYDALGHTERKVFNLSGFDLAVQFNPARVISTAAKVKDGVVEKRPCFLCDKNRPSEQMALEILSGWKFLVNPYPIFPLHFTIVSDTHQPQARVPEDIIRWAELLPGMTVFFNGAKAGASAPDHLHLQAVLKDELPLLNFIEKIHPSSQPGLKYSGDLGKCFPFHLFSGVIENTRGGLTTMMAGLTLGGKNKQGRYADPTLVNTFFWLDSNNVMRFVVIPRKAHRPSCYFEEGESKLLVSPGAIDMAGVIITPRQEDFEKISSADISRIFSEVAYNE